MMMCGRLRLLPSLRCIMSELGHVFGAPLMHCPDGVLDVNSAALMLGACDSLLGLCGCLVEANLDVFGWCHFVLSCRWARLQR
ncbi:hypothetical protein Nepgr_031744 [Nepenthes gracilis]|uniref:Uncharacterized protein n=1 Tax=Nepenthes gracilis TaxID=150966 RepID=A0AAD3TJ32_NEPGR|nr:hypothetical protein Nepgr_031744 [Nepenthes gracilis]